MYSCYDIDFMIAFKIKYVQVVIWSSYSKTNHYNMEYELYYNLE